VPDLKTPVQALTAVYPDYPSADESEWTRMAADHVGMPLHSFVASAGSLDEVERWVSVLDGPVDVLSIPESAESYSAAHGLGARMVMNGEIAEMLFECRAYLLDHLLSHVRVRAAVRELAGRRAQGTGGRKIVRQVVRAIEPVWLVNRYRKTKPYGALPPWVDSGRFVHGKEPPIPSLGHRRRWARMQTAPFQGPGIAFEADEICAAVCGVDSRRPFADVDLWEFVLSLPAEVKFPNPQTKPLLRETVRGLLPDELIDRKDKTYFDEFHLAKADYPALRRLLVDPRHRLNGIDYDLLRTRVEREEMRIYELQWARNVAKVHAFLNQW
jgi:asparagine synthase (glutamine-hydrolysing)